VFTATTFCCIFRLVAIKFQIILRSFAARTSKYLIHCVPKQKAQLSQRDRATLHVIEYFSKSLKKITQCHSKWHFRTMIRIRLKT